MKGGPMDAKVAALLQMLAAVAIIFLGQQLFAQGKQKFLS
jgi:hypothetical protein